MLAAALVCLIAQAPPPEPRWNVGAVAEIARESWRFRFENPSSFDTAELVPHFFEQTYDTAGPYLGLRVTHPVWHERGHLTLAFAPPRTRRADDFDTFFQPDGNTIVSGTTGHASLRSLRLAERFTFELSDAVAAAVEYSYDRHHARYHDGEGIITTTRPPSMTTRVVTTRETAVGQLHQVTYAIEATKRTRGGGLLAGVDLTPIGLARLAVELPDKYPGRLLVFYARVAAVEGQLAYAGRRTHWSWRAAVRAWRTFSWDPASQLDARGVAVTLDVMAR